MPNFMTNLSKFIKERQNSTKKYQSEKQKETSWLVLISYKKIIFSPSIFFSSFLVFIIFEILVLV